MTPTPPEFGEPLDFDQYGDLLNVNGERIVGASYDGEIYWQPHKMNERVKACVNALAGIAHPSKLQALIEACERFKSAYDSGNEARVGMAIHGILQTFRALKPSGWSESRQITMQELELQHTDALRAVKTACETGAVKAGKPQYCHDCCTLFYSHGNEYCNQCIEKYGHDDQDAEDPAERTRER